MNRLVTIAFTTSLLALAFVLCLCRPGTAAEPAAQASAPPATAPSSAVRSITLPTMQPELPPGPGREAAAAGCILCHSTRYITGQPPFPRTQWTATVDKMRKVYGAPMSDEQAKLIVDYLVAVRGTEPQGGGQ